jgi:hypothetical protein
MRRPAHGATSKPGPCGPASGYGREVGRPGPNLIGPAAAETTPHEIEPALFSEPQTGADAAARFTP